MVIYKSKKLSPFWFWENRPLRTSTPSCKPGWNFAFQVPAVSKVNLIATQTFRDKNNLITKQIFSFAWLNFNVYFDVYNKERGRARDKKKEETNFFGRVSWKFYGGGEKMRKARPRCKWVAAKIKWTGTHTIFSL